MWEYKAVYVEEDMYWRMGTLVAVNRPLDTRTNGTEAKFEDRLNALGAEGWELVYVSNDWKRYIFKRKLTAKETKKKNGKQVAKAV